MAVDPEGHPLFPSNMQLDVGLSSKLERIANRGRSHYMQRKAAALWEALCGAPSFGFGGRPR